jgi:hypothetical protein
LTDGVALTTPEPAAGDEQETALRAEFPDIKDPYATALAELEKAETLTLPFRTVGGHAP